MVFGVDSSQLPEEGVETLPAVSCGDLGCRLHKWPWSRWGCWGCWVGLRRRERRAGRETAVLRRRVRGIRHRLGMASGRMEHFDNLGVDAHLSCSRSLLVEGRIHRLWDLLHSHHLWAAARIHLDLVEGVHSRCIRLLSTSLHDHDSRAAFLPSPSSSSAQRTRPVSRHSLPGGRQWGFRTGRTGLEERKENDEGGRRESQPCR